MASPVSLIGILSILVLSSTGHSNRKQSKCQIKLLEKLQMQDITKSVMFVFVINHVYHHEL